MSVREDEERQKKQCPSRGLGLAAAAIGVGVGAALYYYFNKRPEHPDGEGATSSNWTCEEPQALHDLSNQNTSPEMSTDSEDDYVPESDECSDTSVQGEDGSILSISDGNSSSTFTENEGSVSEHSFIVSEVDSLNDSEASGQYLGSPQEVDEASSVVEVSSDSDSDWEMPLNVPESSNSSNWHGVVDHLRRISTSMRDRSQTRADEEMRLIREQPFRERSWSLEECSICCDIMLKDQHIKTLPCTHRFHSGCILPWLETEQQQTCPNCRKQAV